jgi:YVTN family beta-propeller protein
VDVVSLVTKAVEAAIPVGSQPRGLDLSADGKTLYVANSGGEDVSVVDLAQRREVRRITMPQFSFATRPFSIAVAKNGQALVTTTQARSADVVQIDVVDGTVTVGVGTALIGDQARLEPSGDRSRVAILEPAISRIAAYDALTGTVTAGGDYPGAFAALDRTGSTVVTSTNVLDRNLAVLGSLGPGDGDVAVNSTGTIGYRLGDGLEVLDLARRVVERVIPFPVGVDGATRVVLGPDDSTLAVLNSKGVWVTSATYLTPMTPFTVWSQPGNPSLDGTGGWMATANDPVAGPGQLPAKYLYAQYFSFLNGGAVGAIGLVTDPTGKFAVVNVVEPNGTSHAVTTWGKLSPGRLTAVVWFGATGADCADYPRADVYFYPPDGYKAGAHAGSVSSSTGPSPAGGCPVTSSVESGWSRYRAGA